MQNEEKTILYVDDDVDDRELLRDAIQQVAPELKIAFSENGLEALKLLDAKKETQSLPCLIVLDLNMPYLNGKQTFERIKADELLNRIPVVVLSSGQNPADKLWFSNEGITYFSKPVDVTIMEGIASHIADLCS